MKKIFTLLFALNLLISSCQPEMPADPSFSTLGGSLQHLDEYMSQLPRDTIKVLAIGNSFAQDALYDFFFDICKSLNTDVTVGVMHIPSASLQLHLHNALTDSTAYNFRVHNMDGSIYVRDNCPLSGAMEYTDWDYVTLQQVSYQSGRYHSYTSSLPGLLDYVKSHTKESAKIGWHQTWAYESNYVPKEYGQDQDSMYSCIMDASSQAMTDYDFDFIVPGGTAIQNARHTLIGDNLNRDGQHLNRTGKYIVACTWVESIIHKCVIGSKIKPEPNETTSRLSQISAHNAAAAPFEVTDANYVHEIRP